MEYRKATESDLELLGRYNKLLIEDEGHRNPMTVDQLVERMTGWLSSKYEAVIFEQGKTFLAYSLYSDDGDSIYLQQLYVDRRYRRMGIGREAMRILTSEVWPPSKRISVSVLASNQEAYKFWRAVGFEDYSIQLEQQRHQQES